MNLADIYAALDAGEHSPDQRFAGLDPFVARTALAMLTKIVGLPLAAIDLPPPQLSIRFPKDAIPDEAQPLFGGELSRYRAWRRLILDTQMLATRGPVDADPWDGLRRVTRLTIGAIDADALYVLGKHLPHVPPADITVEHGIKVLDGLAGMERQAVRRAWGVLLRLYGHDLAIATKLLPPRLNPLPHEDRLQPHLPLPPRLAAAAATAAPEVRSAAAYCWTLAVRAGLVDEAADPAPEDAFDSGLWVRFAALDPADHGLAFAAATWPIYRQRFARLLTAAGAPKLRMDPVSAAWASLTAAIRATGRDVNVVSMIAAPAKREGLRPQDITPDWIARLQAALPAGQARNATRSACYLLDRLQGDPRIPADLLPAESSGVVRRQARPALPAPPRSPRDPVEQAWRDLFAAARQEGITEDELHPVYVVRGQAKRDGLKPCELDGCWMEKSRQGRKQPASASFAMTARLFDALRDRPALLDHLPPDPIGALRDGRRSADVLPDPIAAELGRLLDAQGAASSTRREASIAVRALAEAAAAAEIPPSGSLGELLDVDASQLDWGRHAVRATDHLEVLARVRGFHRLPWTPAWRALQRAVVAAGVAMRDNPVPALLRHADGRDPQSLDLPWARDIDRRHRRAGRADLARTFEASLGRMDALHAHTGGACSGLLPPRFGPVRPPAPTFTRLPQRLAGLVAAGPARVRTAARVCWTLAVAAGLSGADSDPTPAELAAPDAWARLAAINPAEHGLDVSTAVFAQHRDRFAQMLADAGASDPRCDPVSDAWSALATAVRATGRKTAVLSMIARPAKADGLRPQDLTPDWFARLLAALPEGPPLKATRSACYLIDELRDDPRIPTGLLTAELTGVVRRYNSSSRAAR